MFDRLPYPQSQNRKPLTEEDYAIYAEALSDLPPVTIDAACRKWIEGGRFFPLPADIRSMVANPEKSVNVLIAEESWNAAMDWVRQWYLGPDLGVDRRAPKLDEKQRRALIAAGGFESLMDCSLEELQWAKRRFIENFAHQVTVERDRDLIGSGEAKKILASLTAAMPAKQLSPPAQFRQPKPGRSKPDNATMRAFEDLREKLHAPDPQTAARPTQGLDERLAELQRQAEEVETKYDFQGAAP